MVKKPLTTSFSIPCPIQEMVELYQKGSIIVFVDLFLNLISFFG